MKRKPLFHPRVFKDEKWAASYARRHSKWSKRIGARYAKLMVQRGFKGGKILDSGCGSGALLEELCRTFPNATAIGVDLSEPLLEIARKSAKEKGLSDRLVYRIADVEALPFEPDFFDIVISTGMLHIVENPVKMLNEIERVLKPTGELILGDLRRSGWGYLMSVIKTAYTPEECAELLRKSNLRPWRLEKGMIWMGVLASNSLNEKQIKQTS